MSAFCHLIYAVAEFAFIELSSNVTESDSQVSVVVELFTLGALTSEMAVTIQTLPLDAQGI